MVNYICRSPKRLWILATPTTHSETTKNRRNYSNGHLWSRSESMALTMCRYISIIHCLFFCISSGLNRIHEAMDGLDALYTLLVVYHHNTTKQNDISKVLLLHSKSLFLSWFNHWYMTIVAQGLYSFLIPSYFQLCLVCGFNWSWFCLLTYRRARFSNVDIYFFF